MPHCNKQDFLAGVDCRARRTACCCLKSLRIRIGARANVTEREVTSLVLFFGFVCFVFFLFCLGWFLVLWFALFCFVFWMIVTAYRTMWTPPVYFCGHSTETAYA